MPRKARIQNQEQLVQRKMSVAWPPFQKRLASVLAQLEEDQFLIISVKAGIGFVQFAGQGSFGMRAETVSNSYLPKTEQLDRKQVSALAELGWVSPTGSPENSTPETQPDGSPNFFRDFEQPVNHETIAKLAVATLAEVLRVPHPGFLEYEAFGDDGRLDLPALGLKARKEAEPTDDVVIVRRKLLAAIRVATGVEDLAYDGDGHIPVRRGSAISFTSVMEDPLTIRIYSPLVLGVEDDPAVLARLNDINAKSHGSRFVHRNGTIYALVDLAAQPFVAEQVIHAFHDFMTMADGFDELIKTEFGGETAFKDAFRSSQRH